MILTHLYVFLIWAILFGYIHGSRITNNSIKDTTSLTPDSSAPTDPDLVVNEPEKSNTEETHTTTTQLNSNVNSTSLNQTNQQQITVKNETTISEEDFGANSFRTDLYKETFEDGKKDDTWLNDSAINLFAQRISHNVFHTAELNDKGVSGKLQSLIWSPFSVYQSLVPLFYAAGGETRKELEELLLARVKPLTHSINMTTNDDVSLSSSSSLFLKVSNANDAHKGIQPFSSVTGLFARSNVQLNPDYVQEVLTKVRHVKVNSVDFSDSSNAVKNINAWVNESTQGLIQDAVNENQIDQNMFMIIVNCVRFKASWKTRFDKTLTAVRDFRGVNGIQKVQMMKQIGTQKFAKFPIIFSSDELEVNPANVWHVPFSVLEMPYEEEGLVSLFILPESTENISELLKHIESVGVSEIRRMLDYQDVEVLMPKFKVNSDVNLEEALFESGLKTVFNPATANLSKLVDPFSKKVSDNDMQIPLFPPYLSNIIHRTMFETSEEGTTAAAITAMSIVPLTALSHDRMFLFKLDRPFIVLVVKNDDTMVFQGVITDLIGQELDERNEIEKEVSEKLPTPSSVISKTNLIYPTDTEAKEELNKLINLVKANQEQSSESKHPIEQSQMQDNNEESYQSTDDRSWWIPSRIPEYLNTNNTSLNVSVEGMHKTNSSDKVVIANESQSTPSSPVQSPPPPPPYIPIDSLQYTKYQQPEPKDPNGIRFPATRPLNRNKVNIKPRYENSDHYKNSLLKWMSVY